MIFYRRSVRDRIGPVERALCWTTLAGLGAIAGWIALRGRDVNPDLFRLKDSSLAAADRESVLYRRPAVQFAGIPQGESVSLRLTEDLCGPGWKRQGPVGVFGPDTLYEKIDGREGFYKSYGFRKLWAASYAETQPPEASIDVELFLLGSEMDAFGAFSAERRAAGAAAGGPAGQVATPNGLYQVSGAYYVRFIGSEQGARLRAAVDRGAANLQSRGQIPEAPLRGSAPAAPTATGNLLDSPESWTPLRNPLVEMGADPASLRYQKENGLGMAYFAGLYSGEFDSGGKRLRAYLFAARDEAAARELFRKYTEYLVVQGEPAPAEQFAKAPAGAIAVRDRMLDTWEWCFREGRFVTGVTEAADGDAAALLAARLRQGLTRGTR